MSLNPGDILQNRYRIMALLGQGGMGAVYRAWDLRLKVYVALKEQVPQPGLDATLLAQLRQQFEEEAVTLARLSHPNLVRVTDFFEEGGNAYLVMDLLEGDSLADYISREGRVPEAQVLTWAAQILDALSYCHEQGIVHRDIKPQNILLRPDGRAVLVDFGLVKLWNPNDPLTRTALRGMGTPEYAPPEQYGKQGQTTDPRSDLYSLGATLYHALTGQAPPTASDRMADPELFKPVQTLNPSVSVTTDATISKALEPTRRKRWGTAADMAAAFRNTIGEEIVYHTSTSKPQSASLLIPHAKNSGTAMMPPAKPQSAPHHGLEPWFWILMAGIGLMLLIVALNALGMFTPATLASVVQIKATTTPHRTANVAVVAPATWTPKPEPTFTPTKQPTPEMGNARTRETDGMVMVYVPAGEFQMGSEDADADPNEKPVHPVTLDAFWIDRTEVSVAQFQQFVDATGHETTAEQQGSSFIWAGSNWEGVTGADWMHPAGPNSRSEITHPVVHVSRGDAVTYCRWIGGRLPTEAEWEYAARGPEGLKYPWGDGFDCAMGNFDDERRLDSDIVPGGVDCDGFDKTAPIGSFPEGASWIGALDLAGNVWEWTADWIGPYPSWGQRNPTGPQSGEHRVMRGGSWNAAERYVRSAYRGWVMSAFSSNDAGFRCVVPGSPSE